jgi:hypothetical protein
MKLFVEFTYAGCKTEVTCITCKGSNPESSPPQSCMNDVLYAKKCIPFEYFENGYLLPEYWSEYVLKTEFLGKYSLFSDYYVRKHYKCGCWYEYQYGIRSVKYINRRPSEIYKKILANVAFLQLYKGIFKVGGKRYLIAKESFEKNKVY